MLTKEDKLFLCRLLCYFFISASIAFGDKTTRNTVFEKSDVFLADFLKIAEM